MNKEQKRINTTNTTANISIEEVECETKYNQLREEIKRIKQNIGQLRQWLNERTEDRLITNEDIETFLNK